MDVEIIQSLQICTLKNYYEDYQKFIKICAPLLALLDLHDSDDVKLMIIDLITIDGYSDEIKLILKIF